MRIRLRLLETVVEIHTDDDAAARFLRMLWSSMETDEPGTPDRAYDVRPRDDGWVATANGDAEAIHETLWGLTDALRYRMLELCEERLRSFVSVHAAAVARDDDLILLAGDSGAGKTTLTLALLQSGWTYLTDDLAPVALDSAMVHPFPKPLGVKDPARWPSVRDAFGELGELAPPTGSFLVPPSLWKVANEPLAPRAIFFSTYEPGADVVVEEVTAAEAAARASAYLRQLDPQRVALLNALCSRSSCFRLRYGATQDAIAAIERALDTSA